LKSETRCAFGNSPRGCQIENLLSNGGVFFQSRQLGTPLQSLRHTHASHLIVAGLDVPHYQSAHGPQFAHGHAQRLYGNLFASTADRAAQIMEDTFAAVRSE
jgi:hypothetical protein